MAANDNRSIELSWRVYGLGLIAMSTVGFVVGDFISGQPVPDGLPAHTAFAYLAAAFMLVMGLGIERRRTVTWAAAAIIAYFSLIVLLMENGRVIFQNYAQYGAYFGVAEPLSIIAGASIIYAATSGMDAASAARLARIAQLAFGASAIFFGGAHFVYMNYTAPLIPKWLPPNQEFWGYATGVFHIASGVAILTGIQARLAALLAALMYALFIPLVFVPVLLTETHSAFRWTELATTVVLIGVAWTVADSLKGRG